MLSKLLGSKARVKLLKKFLLNPNEKFYIRQLARELKLQLNSVRRELENLEQVGLLKSNLETGKEEGGQEKRFYKVDPEFVLFEEIKALMVKAQVLYEKDFLDKINKSGTPKLVVFTGFFVNNMISPVDLLIVGRFNKDKLIKLIKSLEEDVSREINFTVLSVREYRYRRDITDVFLYDILEGRKLVAIDEIGLT